MQIPRRKHSTKEVVSHWDVSMSSTDDIPHSRTATVDFSDWRESRKFCGADIVTKARVQREKRVSLVLRLQKVGRDVVVECLQTDSVAQQVVDELSSRHCSSVIGLWWRTASCFPILKRDFASFEHVSASAAARDDRMKAMMDNVSAAPWLRKFHQRRSQEVPEHNTASDQLMVAALDKPKRHT